MTHLVGTNFLLVNLISKLDSEFLSRDRYPYPVWFLLDKISAAFSSIVLILL